MNTFFILVESLKQSLPSPSVCGLVGIVAIYLLYRKTKLFLLGLFILASFWSATQFSVNPALEESGGPYMPLVFTLMGFVAVAYGIYSISQSES